MATREELISGIQAAEAQNLGGGRLDVAGGPALGESSFLEEELIPLMGETVAPLLAEGAAAKVLPKLIPHGGLRAAAEIGLGGLAAFTGRIAGEELNEEIQDFTGSKFAPEINEFVSDDTLEQGVESAAFDMVMNSAFKGGVVALRSMGVTPAAAMKQWNELLQENGGHMTLGQIADESVKGNLVRGVEEVLRGAAGTKGAFKLSNEKNYSAVAKIVAERSNNLTQEALGRLVVDTLRGGTELQGKIAGDMFGFLDEVVTTIPQQTTKVLPPRSGIETVGRTVAAVENVPPVDVSEARFFANEIAKKLKAQGGFTDVEGRLSSLATGQHNLTFKDTHELMSRLKRAQRDDVFASAGIANSELHTLIGQLDSAFDAAGKKVTTEGGEDVAQLYKSARDFTREGHKIFSTDFLTQLAKTDPSRVGAALTGKSTPTEIRELKRMVERADAMALEAGGEAGPGTWRQVQEGYVAQMFPTQFADDAALFGDALGNAPAFKLLGGGAPNKRFQEATEAMLGKDQTEQMQKGLVVLRDTIMENPEVGTLTSRQTSAVATPGGDKVGMGARIIGTLLAPLGASRLFTDPKLIDMLIRWKSLKVGSTAAKRAGVKLLTAIDDIAQDDTVREAVGLQPVEEE